MKKLLAGLALSAALIAGSAAAVSTPADAAGIYVNIGPHHHWHHWRGYYWHNQYWHHRYWCDRWHHRWCYR
jgi:opacity protein-like surface antigen